MRIALDLLPENQKTVRLPVWLWTLAFVLLITLVFHAIYVGYHISDPKVVYEKKIADLKTKVKVASESLPLKKDVKQAVKKAGFINFLLSEGRINFYSILSALEDSLKPGFYIDEFTVKNKTMVIKGTALNMNDIYIINGNLLKSAIFTDIKMSHSHNESTYKYIFRMKLNDES